MYFRIGATCAVALLTLAACHHNDRTGASYKDPTVGQAVGNAADNTKVGLDNFGTKARDAIDPPRGPAEKVGRSVDRATSGN